MEEASAGELPHQWKLPTPALLLLLILAMITAFSLCISILLKKKQSSSSCAQSPHCAGEQPLDPAFELPSSSKNMTSVRRCEVTDWLRSLIRKLLGGTGSSCWSRSLEGGDNRHVDYDHESCADLPVLGGGWDMPTPARTVAASPLWGRRILMGGRCEMPRFSGLILYDEKGTPLGHSSGVHNQDKLKAAGITTLRDLL